MSLCLKYLVQSSKWRFQLGIWEAAFFGLRLSFYLWVPDMDFFAIASLILSHLELSRMELPNLISSILMEFFQRLDFLKSLSLSQMHLDIVLKSLVSILSRQVISLKKMMMSSAKFTVLISYLYSFNPFIGVNETGKYLSCNNV